MNHFSRRVLERLMRYYWFVAAKSERDGVTTITSAQIGDALEIDPTQVRKDLGAIGLLGIGRVGFDVCEVCRGIRITLGFDRLHEAVLIGAGHLGGALLAYEGFATYGLHIVAGFDHHPQRVGRKVGGCTIKPMRTLGPFIRRNNIPLAILTTPAPAAQRVTDRVVAAGVKGIWNFTPAELTVPDGILVRNEHISIGLAVLMHRLRV